MRALLTSATAVGLWAAAAAPALPRTAPDVPAAAGVVEGTVRLGAADQAAPAMLSPYARRRYSPPAAARASGTVGDVVVYLLAATPSASAPPREVTVAQRALTIAPHVTPVQAGTKVSFPNEDNVFHNLFSLSATQPFNLGRYPRGESRSQLFRKPGVVRMFCDIHSDMSGLIVVLPTPHFTQPDASGRFRLAGVPEGRHRVVAWHESQGADTVVVVVGPGGAATADLRIPR